MECWLCSEMAQGKKHAAMEDGTWEMIGPSWKMELWK